MTKKQRIKSKRLGPCQAHAYVQDEEEMINEEAVKMRRKYPALGKAWKHYKTVWHLIMGQNR